MSDALRLLDHPLSSALGWTLVHFVWQGAVLGLVAFFLLRVIRPAQASTRYLIGVATLVAMMMAPVVTFFSGADSPTGSPFNRGTVAGLSDGIGRTRHRIDLHRVDGQPRRGATVDAGRRQVARRRRRGDCAGLAASRHRWLDARRAGALAAPSRRMGVDLVVGAARRGRGVAGDRGRRGTDRRAARAVARRRGSRIGGGDGADADRLGPSGRSAAGVGAVRPYAGSAPRDPRARARARAAPRLSRQPAAVAG